MKILVASKNMEKLKELEQILSEVLDDFELVSLRDYPDLPPAEETGKTFLENAIIKAKYYMEQTGLPTIADDSGLMVFALDFRPGVHSARYGGEASYAEKCNRLLDELKAIDDMEQRRARFVSAVVFITPEGGLLYSIGTCDGYITKEQRGTGGFGFDPIFMPIGYDKTFAEMTPEEKNKISHRGQALRTLAKSLAEFMEYQKGEGG